MCVLVCFNTQRDANLQYMIVIPSARRNKANARLTPEQNEEDEDRITDANQAKNCVVEVNTEEKMRQNWSFFPLHLIILDREHELPALRQSQWSGKSVLEFCFYADCAQLLLPAGKGPTSNSLLHDCSKRALLKVLLKMKWTHTRLLKLIYFNSAFLQALNHSNPSICICVERSQRVTDVREKCVYTACVCDWWALH